MASTLLIIILAGMHMLTLFKRTVDFDDSRPNLTCVFGETYCKGGLLDFLFEQIFLVEEEDDRGVCEPFIVTDGIKQFQTLLHAILK